MTWALLFLSFFAAASPPPAKQDCQNQNIEKARQLKLHSSPQWLALLHQSRGLFGVRSEIDDHQFFLDPSGDSKPEAELHATIAAFCEDRSFDTKSERVPRQQAHCLYPARERFFETHGLTGWPRPECAEFNEWKTRVGREALHLVFSSYYANNPSSVFGHTLLRVDKIQPLTGVKMSPLLSYGINYAANPTTSNGVLYAILGMTGGFKGQFASLPYYYKVREYSDFDSRDLWEFELNLTAAQTAMILDHIWEMGFTDMNYYYFTKNCSYQILRVLETAMPEHKLHTRVPWWVIPIDSVKAVTTLPGLVKEVRFRPSLYKQWVQRMDRIREARLEEAYEHAKKNLGQNMTVTPESQALIFDALLDEWDFRYTKDLLDPKSKASLEKQRLLEKRAALPTTPPLVSQMELNERPDQSHDSARIGLGFVNQSEFGHGAQLDMRFALHDFSDPRYGYPRNAKVEFFRFRGEYFADDHRWQISDAKFFEIQLLAPFNSDTRPYSWQVQMGLNRKWFDCDYCLAGAIEAKGGFSLSLFNERLLVYTMAGGEVRAAESQRRFVRGRPELAAGLIVHLPLDLHLSGDLNHFWDELHGLENTFEGRAELRKNWGTKYSAGFVSKSEWTKDHSQTENSATFYKFF